MELLKCEEFWVSQCDLRLSSALTAISLLLLSLSLPSPAPRGLGSSKCGLSKPALILRLSSQAIPVGREQIILFEPCQTKSDYPVIAKQREADMNLDLYSIIPHLLRILYAPSERRHNFMI